MRTIKFRGERVSNGQLIYGYVYEYDQLVLMGDKKTPTDFYIISPKWPNEAFKVKPESIGQFTGFHYKNGEEIYEGDYIDDWQVTFTVHGWVLKREGSEQYLDEWLAQRGVKS